MVTADAPHDDVDLHLLETPVGGRASRSRRAGV
jgi:hypothetical protein